MRLQPLCYIILCRTGSRCVFFVLVTPESLFDFFFNCEIAPRELAGALEACMHAATTLDRRRGEVYGRA